MDLLLGFVVAVGVTMALIPPLIKIAPRWQFLDLPQSRKVHENPIPRVGGIAMAAGVLLALGVWGNLATATSALIAGIVVLVAFGMWDDRVSLSAGPKFLGQAVAVLVVMIWGDVSIGSLTLADRYVMPEWIAAPLTFFFLIGATNAINLADGLDGLAGGTTLMCLAGLALLAFTVGSPQVGGVSLLIIGAVLGFLRYNTYPARVFMGDTGSQLLGFSAAVLSVMLTQDVAAPLSSALPLLLLGVPIIDTLTVMAGRMLAGYSPFKADRNHIHHRLLALGFDHHEAVMTIYLAQGAFFVTAWFMRYESDVAITSAFALLAAAIVLPLLAAKAAGWRWRAQARDGQSPSSGLRATLAWLAAPQRLPLWCVYIIACSVGVFALFVMYKGVRPPIDTVVLAGIAALALAVNNVIRWSATEFGWVDKSALYLCAVLLVYLSEADVQDDALHAACSWIPIVAIALAVAIRMRLSLDRRFVVTPLDVLVIIVAAAIPNLPDSIASSQALGAGVAKLVVLFYGIETLSVVAQKHWKWLSLAAFFVLVVCASRGL
jgi:UDP-GlcNAc:undecaprenyl-phosphate GlcNAc-1-phosphate transferase